MKRILTTLALGALLVGSGAMSVGAQEAQAHEAQAHRPPMGNGGAHGPEGGHEPQHGNGPDRGQHPLPGGGGREPFPGGGRDPFPGGNHGPDRWHGPEHNWGGGWDRHSFHGAWFWFGPSVVLLWDGANYVETPVFYDADSGLYYYVDAFGQTQWLN